MDPDFNPSITPYPNGPYYVNDVTSFANQRGPIRTRPTMVLCRCGASANKPFCDGTHVKIGFSSAKLEGTVENKRDNYVGRGITIHDNRATCSHAGLCTKGLPSVFRRKQVPWIDPDAADRNEVIKQVLSCPSGALTYSVAGLEYHAPESSVAIFIMPNGPYVVTGAPELRNTIREEGAPTERFALCRCGGSNNKPFCDGSHRQIGFKDEKN